MGLPSHAEQHENKGQLRKREEVLSTAGSKGEMMKGLVARVWEGADDEEELDDLVAPTRTHWEGCGEEELVARVGEGRRRRGGTGGPGRTHWAGCDEEEGRGRRVCLRRASTTLSNETRQNLAWNQQRLDTVEGRAFLNGLHI